jgi:carboxyl-terminal processing protease
MYAISALVLIVATFFAGISVGTSSKEDSYSINPVISSSGVAIKDPHEVDMTAFWKVWTTLDNRFVGTSTTDAQKMYGAMSGLTDSYKDSYTMFFPPQESKAFQEEVSGNFGGIGAEISEKDGYVTIVTPLKGTPAEKAGLKPGDKILKINATSTKGMSSENAISLIRGEAGTKVTLTIYRDGAKEPLVIPIVRGIIDVPVIETKIVSKDGTISSSTKKIIDRENDVFVISLYSFTSNSAQLFRNALRQFIDSGTHRLIIDLRGNPGGYLDAAVDIASWFLPSGKIVLKEKEGKEGKERDYRSKGYSIFNDNLKLAVLVDKGSASASEILAGALSDNGVATLVGTQTFGKGSVQQVIDITEDTSLKVTIAKWFTPKGKSISEVGIKPDVIVEYKKDDVKNNKDPQLMKAVEIVTK